MLLKFSQIVNRSYAFIYETNHSKSGLGLPSIVALVMVIDKSWTSLGKHKKAFYTGLKKFVDDCKPLVDSTGNIRCPCKSCRLVLWVPIKHLSDHISKYGFDPSYNTWIHHGEPDLPLPPPVIDNTRQPQMSDMTACLNDLRYIPLNNEQNEPTQGDIGETTNDPTQAKRNEFKELYASANEELYPGCDYVNRLDFMAKITYFKVKGKLTDSIFNEMLEFFQNVFPTAKGYKLPPSYYVIKKTFKAIGLGYESIHACVNDYFLFWGDANKDVHFCPVCNTSIWKDSNTLGKKVPKKMSADLARGHGGDGGGDDRPPPYQIPTGCRGCLINHGRGTRKPNLGGRRAGRMHTRQETRNLRLKAIMDKNGPVLIRFEFGDRETLMHLDDHVAHWANYLGELVRELPMYYSSWRQMPPERKAKVVAKIG
ncbi:reverse transcriptase domain-containing protein, partial [Tanacetum coccineum]